MIIPALVNSQIWLSGSNNPINFPTLDESFAFSIMARAIFGTKFDCSAAACWSVHQRVNVFSFRIVCCASTRFISCIVTLHPIGVNTCVVCFLICRIEILYHCVPLSGITRGPRRC
ncbi:hypothetical protein HanPSC8_Chr15g0654971 [Helianthus annuus]|nr:hypothetical protein HanPSC8_Chr15g0654971 [Helianthus annuus]